MSWFGFGVGSEKNFSQKQLQVIRILTHLEKNLDGIIVLFSTSDISEKNSFDTLVEVKKFNKNMNSLKNILEKLNPNLILQMNNIILKEQKVYYDHKNKRLVQDTIKFLKESQQLLNILIKNVEESYIEENKLISSNLKKVA